MLARFESRLPAKRMTNRLPSILILSDTARGYDMEQQVTTWPNGVAFIERTYAGQPIAAQRRLGAPLRLATCTPQQARKAHLDGLHWPQKRLKYRRVSATSDLVETTSAHGGLAVAKAAKLGMNAILVSTAFESKSPSATRPLGAIRLALLQRLFPKAHIYALGGINLQTAKLLAHTHIAGVALVSFGDNKRN
jgi:thiamine-phosphate pyrophosphorylase